MNGELLGALPVSVSGPLDFERAYADFCAEQNADRGDNHRLHASDLGGCDFATMLRLRGEPSLPYTQDDLDRFSRGHMFEREAKEAIFRGLGFDYHIRWGIEGETRGVVGHLDGVIYEAPAAETDVVGPAIAVIDVSSTAGKTADWQYGHALKSAFYAVQVGAPWFCEWVFRVGFGGVVKEQKAHWFRTEDWAERVAARIAVITMIESGEYVPPVQPPMNPKDGERESWRCKAYCNAPCHLNQRVSETERQRLARAQSEEVPL